MCTPLDLRVCFVGDSFVAGIGDETALGWVGRLVQRQVANVGPITAYNLGIRRDTSGDVLARLRDETSRRFVSPRDSRIVLSFGVNDTVVENTAPRVSVAESQSNLVECIRVVDGIPLLFVGPPPVNDEDHNERISVLNESFKTICADAGHEFVDVFSVLCSNETWRRQVRQGDGAHPGAQGYAALSELVAPTWDRWILTA